MTAPPGSALRALIVDDSRLFRDGLATLLRAAGVDVVAEFGRADHLADAVSAFAADVVVMDARMPPTHTDEGIRAALSLRADRSDIGVLVLSTYAEGAWAAELFAHGSSGLGYLLKDRVDNVAVLVDAIARVGAGGTVVDPEVVTRLLAVNLHRSALDVLSPREHEVLALMAEGKSNNGIGHALNLSARTVEVHIAAIFAKLPLGAESNTSNRRVLSVLTYLQESASA